MTIHSDNITPLPPMTEAVARLPHHMAVILCQLALLGELSKTALLDNLHILDISPVSHRRMNSAEITWALDLCWNKVGCRRLKHAGNWLQAMKTPSFSGCGCSRMLTECYRKMRVRFICGVHYVQGGLVYGCLSWQETQPPCL